MTSPGTSINDVQFRSNFQTNHPVFVTKIHLTKSLMSLQSMLSSLVVKFQIVICRYVRIKKRQKIPSKPRWREFFLDVQNQLDDSYLPVQFHWTTNPYLVKKNNENKTEFRFKSFLKRVWASSTFETF